MLKGKRQNLLEEIEKLNGKIRYDLDSDLEDFISELPEKINQLADEYANQILEQMEIVRKQNEKISLQAQEIDHLKIAVVEQRIRIEKFLKR